ncbi:hypothetical protein DPMN_002809 [Dreissena polymorpha]|uniref:Uncharacterized protein n=1 Tax=Dreissena polymorpha TaxID=45954 RepID=A0A9D4RU88_DREPO|nr:hypothetical protein DPMN_002809 [Dreissena polymorpha]
MRPSRKLKRSRHCLQPTLHFRDHHSRHCLRFLNQTPKSLFQHLRRDRSRIMRARFRLKSSYRMLKWLVLLWFVPNFAVTRNVAKILEWYSWRVHTFALK